MSETEATNPNRTGSDAPHRVLVVDDEDDIREPIQWRLEADGYDVTAVATGAEAVRAVSSISPDIVILDMVLPDIDGVDVLKQVRAAGSDAIVMLLSGKSDEVDRVIALASGADDFVLKPCSPRELAARLLPYVRRRASAPQVRRVVTSVGLVVDIASRVATVDGSRINLTDVEFNVLAALSAHRGILRTREQLEEELAADTDHDIAGIVRRLRQKVEPDPSTPRFLKTVRGRGYVLVN